MENALLRKMMVDPALFRRNLVIDTSGGRQVLTDVMDDWQAQDFVATDAGWMRAVGVPTDGGGDGGAASGATAGVTEEVISRAYLERPRGHSKTNDLAVMITWAVFAAKRRVIGTGTAADREQARLLRGAVQGLAQVNPWLRDFVDCQRDRVVNPHTNSELFIQSSDAFSAYGTTPDFLVLDELTHWGNRQTWDAVFSSAARNRIRWLRSSATRALGREILGSGGFGSMPGIRRTGIFRGSTARKLPG